ncbi:MAG TPA: hypothetical protein VFB27_08150 [Opitutaceae bacterium]|nr:hypothetical protein [Opitutaceae bacterium]
MKELLQQPEYVHALLVPALTHALPFAALGLIAALIARRRAAIVLALALVFVSAAAVWPAVHYGHLGYDRVEEMADQNGDAWLTIHRHRADDNQWVFYTTAAVALAALLLPLKWPRSALPLALLAVIAALGASGIASYIAYAGGKIRHREFRTGPPPPAELKEAQQDKD